MNEARLVMNLLLFEGLLLKSPNTGCVVVSLSLYARFHDLLVYTHTF